MLAASNLIEQFPKFVPESVPQMHEYFGHAVAIDGNRAIIGAPQSSDISTDPGVAYVYEQVAGRWKQVAMLTSPDAERGAFGSKVAIDGDTIVVAAQGLAAGDEDDEYDNTGAVYVYTGGGASWSLQATITPSEEQSNDGFGTIIDIDGDTIAVASRPTSHPAHLSDFVVQVFERVNTEWIETYHTDSISVPAYSGVVSALAIDGDVLAVGSPWASPSGAANSDGAVYIHERRNGAWSYSKGIAAPIFGSSMAFGTAIGLDEGTLIVGAPADTLDAVSEYAGAAYIYQQSSDDWSFTQRISISELGGAAGFGSTLTLDGDSLAVVGRMWRHIPRLETAHLFVRDEDGLWSRRAKTRDEAVDSNFSFGLSIGLSGTTLLIGSPFDDTVGTNDGAVFAYEMSSANADVSVYEARQLGLDLVEVDSGFQGLNSAVVFSVYRSTDSIFDVDDLDHLVTQSPVVAVNGTSTYSFDPGPFDPARPYLIIVAASGVEEHTLENNQVVIRLSQPSGIELHRQLPNTISEAYTGGATISSDGDWTAGPISFPIRRVGRVLRDPPIPEDHGGSRGARPTLHVPRIETLIGPGLDGCGRALRRSNRYGFRGRILV